MYGYGVDHVVGQVLVQVGQTIWILREGLVLTSQSITCSQLSKPKQVNYIQGTDVVASVAKVILPVA